MACTTYRNVNYIKIRKILHQEDATVADIIFVYEPEVNVLLLMNWWLCLWFNRLICCEKIGIEETPLND